MWDAKLNNLVNNTSGHIYDLEIEKNLAQTIKTKIDRFYIKIKNFCLSQIPQSEKANHSPEEDICHTYQ